MIFNITKRCLKNILIIITYSVLLFYLPSAAAESDFSVPGTWVNFQPILKSRLTQKSLKMKLEPKNVDAYVQFLRKLDASDVSIPELINLQKILPKTTLELLMAVHARGLELDEAEKMAFYLKTSIERLKLKNIKAFDENTSHIIGREWSEIDYSGENMTWQKQRQKYKPYGVEDFKSVESLSKFFQIESRMPYFKRIYQPQNPKALTN